MTVVRTMAAIAVVGFSMAVPLTSQQEIDPNRLFVRVQTQLQPKPSPSTAGQVPILRPGTLLTATPDTPQSGAFVQVWTPAAFRELKKEGRRLLIRGGLFYDSGHIVNTDENSKTSQPKRFTIWEIHPITAVLVCKRQDNKCDPATATDWTPLK